MNSVPGSRAVGIAAGRADDHGALDLPDLRPVARHEDFVVVIVAVAVVAFSPLVMSLVVEVALQARRPHHRPAAGGRVLLPVPPLRHAVAAVAPPVWLGD